MNAQLETGGEDGTHDLFRSRDALKHFRQAVLAQFLHAVGFGGLFQFGERARRTIISAISALRRISS